ncbi:hypothetical protein N7E02_03490 (plasmid) [Aliirhizobium terrae]|nr:hypothetical protein [Rhizobium sp. CC-CFT758]WJH37851.1 hypothetical protein N7E02_03490 [Rhizobium sp. CC-CFT758]
MYPLRSDVMPVTPANAVAQIDEMIGRAVGEFGEGKAVAITRFRYRRF